jgi:hypothetical protein
VLSTKLVQADDKCALGGELVGGLKMFEKTGLVQPFSKVNQPFYGMK